MFLRHSRRRWWAGVAAATAMCIPASAAVLAPSPADAASSPIQHVVLIYQENHSFDDVLGRLCATTLAGRCDGATTGVTSTGAVLPLTTEPDIVPNVGHNTQGQVKNINGGAMDGFDKESGCAGPAYACYEQVDPAHIPNLTALATRYVIADRTREMDTIPSFGSHLELAAQTRDGFYAPDDPQYNPLKLANVPANKVGWGCDSNKDSLYGNAASSTWVPSCVPDPALPTTTYPFGGAYRSTPVQPTPTIFDRLTSASVSWKLYTSNRIWSICPTFASCLYTNQVKNMVKTSVFPTDAASTSMPSFSIVLPDGATGKTSQHNGTSMAAGDNFIQSTVQSVMNGPNWNSTAIFITYDDCGCFYDHVPPVAASGIRVPMVIVSPYAKPAFTDHTDATFSGVLAFMEHQLGVQPVNGTDQNAYDFSNSFDFTQTPLAPLKLAPAPLPAGSLAYLAAHPPAADST